MKNFIKLFSLLLIGAVAFQGFQCSSREMTTAKVALKSGEVEKAKENLKLELEKNPKNGEAYILLAELSVMERNMPAAIEYMNKAEPLVENDPKLKDKPKQLKFEFFKEAIQTGEESFNRYNQTKDIKELAAAAGAYSISVQLRPNFFEGYRRMGLAYEIADKQDEAIKAYEEYLKVIQPSIDIAIQNDVYVGANTKSFVQKTGKPTFLRGTKHSETDSTVLEKYTVEGNDLFMLSEVKNGENYVLSWSYDPPKNILQAEREIVPDAITQPINSLASIYYRKKEKDNSLKYFRIVSSIDPQDENANSAIVTLYQELGKPDEAIKAINENVKKNPQNPIFIAQLGDVYMNQGDYDKAIQQYENALKVKPDFDAALRNVAACYGNKAAKAQQEQNDLVNEGKAKTVDTNTYHPALRKAAEYFTKATKTSTYEKDPDVWGDLCNIYMALLPKEKSLFESTLSKLESLERNISNDKKEQYYFKLLKIYGQTDNPKYSEMEKKINQLD